jgi:BASS family bile acid:Na+ symporter
MSTLWERSFWMSKFKRIFRNRNIIFLVALSSGLLAPYAVPLTRHLVLPALGLVMALSMMDITSDLFLRPRSLFFPALLGIIMNYVILGNVIIGISALMIRDEMLWTGFVLLAAAPPAVAVIPFSGFLRGDGALSLIGTVGAYMGALVIVPLISLTLLGSATFDPYKLLMIILELIALPLAVSRLLIRRRWNKQIESSRGAITNWSFFLILYTMIGLNHNIILNRSTTLLTVALISIITTFILGFLIDWVCSLFHIPRETRTSLVLLGTFKNQALAGGLALTLFAKEASLPAAVSSVIMVVYFIWLDFKKRWD